MSKNDKQFKNKPEAELKKSVSEYKDKLWVLKKDLAAGKVKNVRSIKKFKKDIARALTALSNI